jgi:uncharacterized membrane protein YidH (DUF202 family)
MTEVLQIEVLTDERIEGALAPTGPLSRLGAQSRAILQKNGFGTWVGIGMITIGVILIVVAWAQSSGETQVARQLPYLMSGGVTGLGLIVVGVAIVSLDAKARESRLRTDRADSLASSLAAVQRALEGRNR